MTGNKTKNFVIDYITSHNILNSERNLVSETNQAVAASTLSQPVPAESAEKLVDLLLEVAADYPRPTEEIPKSPVILNSRKLCIPHPPHYLSSQNPETRKHPLTSVQELERHNIPPTSSSCSLNVPTTLSVVQPASSLYHSSISTLSVSKLNSMCELSGSADISRRSESFDTESDIDPVIGGILKPQNDLASSEADIRCFACDTEKIKQCWLHAMRLAKVSKHFLISLIISM